jgi:anti-sigma B factor antagonist
LSLSISSDTLDDAVVIHVGGDLDVYTAPRLKEVLDEAVAGGGRLILDLSEVHFIDSTALSVLVGTHQDTQSSNGEFRLVVEDPFLLKIFHITGFDGVFSIFPQVSDAISTG